MKKIKKSKMKKEGKSLERRIRYRRSKKQICENKKYRRRIKICEIKT